MNFIFLSIVGYLVGSISNAYIVGKMFKKVDIRQYGSGNAGATNVTRVMGFLPGFITLCADIVKGMIAAYIGGMFAGPLGAIICSTFSIIGHNWPVFFGFRGGKGVATSLGCLIIIDPFITLIVVCIGLLIMLITKYVSLGSIVSAASYPVIALLLKKDNLSIIFAFIVGLMIIIKHRSNINRLISGTEPKIGEKKIY
ncbi:MAG: glycerol-3-phosphate 1-O-acyltransferase PlsY [Clostridia bacterium]|nr:glycerol-3-phosphate 1-O-acyltransferase PlsY [Clostridia bacterium]